MVLLQRVFTHESRLGEQGMGEETNRSRRLGLLHLWCLSIFPPPDLWSQSHERCQATAVTPMPLTLHDENLLGTLRA